MTTGCGTRPRSIPVFARATVSRGASISPRPRWTRWWHSWRR
jgi:hypothetical protein